MNSPVVRFRWFKVFGVGIAGNVCSVMKDYCAGEPSPAKHRWQLHVKLFLFCLLITFDAPLTRWKAF